MYSRYDYQHHIPPAMSRHAILEGAFDADAKHPVRHVVLEVAAILAPVIAVAVPIAAILL